MKRSIPLLLLPLAAACVSKTEVVLGERTVTTLGSAGGAARSADGALRLVFAPDTLSEPTEITIETRRDRQVPGLRSLVWELGPSGMSFAKPVTVLVSATAAAGEELAIAQVDAAYPEVVAGSEHDRAASEVRAALAHFSSYAVVSVYLPCTGRICGESCTICDPADPSCTEPPPVDKQCNRSGLCVAASAVTCTVPDGGVEAGPDVPPGDGPVAGDVPVLDGAPLPPDAEAPDAEPGDAPEPADAGPTQCTETFTQRIQPQADILLVIDDSCSMSEEQAVLASSFPVLLNTLTSNNVDFHIGVTTTDVEASGPQGALIGTPAVLSSSTPSLAQVFASSVQAGIDGSAFEQGLEAARLALSPALLAGANAGFRRPEAALTVIVLSDEEDQSNGSEAYYVGEYLTAAGNGDFQLNAIVGDAPAGCSTSLGAGLRYIGVSQASGGVFSSICSPPWASALTDLGPAGFGYQRSFIVAMRPASLNSVTINGVPVSSTLFSYDPVNGVLEFDNAAVPEAGADVEVRYDCP